MKISSNIQTVMERFHSLLDVQKNFDIVYHTMENAACQALGRHDCNEKRHRE